MARENRLGFDYLIDTSGGGAPGPASPVQAPADTIALASARRLVDIDTTPLGNGTLIKVLSVESVFQLDKTSALASDGITIVTPNVGPGRWLRVPGGSIKWLRQTAWFFDAAGNDENDGATALTALRNLPELTRRLQGMSENGLTVTANVLVTLAAGSYGKLVLDLDVASGISFQVQGAFTSTANEPVDAFVTSDPATNVRGRVDRAAFVFTDITRLRLTSGTQSGARAYVTRVPAAGQGEVTRFFQFDPLVASNPTIVNPAVPADFVIDTLTSTIGQQDVRNRGAGRIVIRDCIVEASPAHRAVNDSGVPNGVIYSSCQFQTSSSKWYQSVVKFVGCDFRVFTVFFNGLFATRATTFRAGLLNDANAYCNMSDACCFDGVSASPDFAGLNVAHDGFVLFTAATGGPDAAQFVDIPATRTAIRLDEASRIASDKTEARLWGANNAATSTCVVRSGGAWTWVGNSKPNIPGGTNDVNIGGNLMTYAALGTGFVAASQAFMVERVP